MRPYTVRQLDQQGGVISEKHVEAPHAEAALRQLTGITERTRRIEVYDADHKKVEEVLGDYWRDRIRRNRR
jgi:hypothetical protein